MRYWVVGGIYKNTDFVDLQDGHSIEKYGPFESYDEAKKVWDRYSWKNVDECFTRYTIVDQK